MRKNKTPVPSEEVRAEASDVNTLPERLSQIYYRYPTVLARVICQNPRTSPELLEKLSETKALQPLIARNPNAPMPLLYQLWAKHPNALLENPGLPLWQLEDPGFCCSLPEPALKGLLSIPSLGGGFLESVWERARSLSYDAIAQLLLHPNLPEHLIIKAAKKEHHSAIIAKRPDLRDESIFLLLLGSTQVHTRQTVAAHPNLPKDLSLLCQRVGWFAVYSERGEADPTVTAEELMRLVKSGPFLVNLIVQHPSVSSEVLHAIADHFPLDGSQQRDEIWRFLAGHQKGDESLCLRLIRGAPSVCASYIASSSALTHRVCKELLRATANPKSFSVVLTAMCHNKSTPDVVLARLVRQYTAHCASLIVSRKILSRQVILALRECSILGVRRALGRRTDLTSEDRAALAADLVKKRRVKAPKREGIDGSLVSLFASLLSALSSAQLREFVRHPLTPHALLLWASTRLNEPVEAMSKPAQKYTQRECLQLLRRGELLPHQLEDVLCQDDPLVRRALARHRGTPLIFLLSVICRREPGELLALSYHENLPAPIKQWVDVYVRPRIKRCLGLVGRTRT